MWSEVTPGSFMSINLTLSVRMDITTQSNLKKFTGPHVKVITGYVIVVSQLFKGVHKFWLH